MPGIFSNAFTYKTVNYTVNDVKPVGVLYRLIQLSIFSYIIGWVFVIKKGYQEKDESILSSVVSKLKGVSVTNTTESGLTVWGPEDYAIPPKGDDAPFIVTNFIEIPNQKLGLCAESPTALASHCTTDDNCKEGQIVLHGNGVMSGRCRKDGNSNGTCEIYAWCPVVVDNIDRKKKHILTNAENFTIYIKNFIKFSHFDFAKSNVHESPNNSYLSKCTFGVEHNLYCPIFRLGDITKMAGQNFQDMAPRGGIMGIKIEWNCDLDEGYSNCHPKYDFKRLDHSILNTPSVTAGFNFRHTRYFQNDAGERSRVLYKVYGIRFNIMVHGKAGQFGTIPTMINIASALGMMGFAQIFCDLLLNLLLSSRIYRKRNCEGTGGSDVEISDQVYNERKGLCRLKLLGHCFHHSVPIGPLTVPTAGSAAPLATPTLT